MLRKISLALLMAILILGVSRFVSAQAEEANSEVAVSQAEDLGNKICPVTGEEIGEETKATYEYQGKIYNFCCPMCIEEFKKDPEKYIKKVEEELRVESKSGEKGPENMHMHEGQQ